MGKIKGPLQIRLLKRSLGLLEEPARPTQGVSLGWRQPFPAETHDSFFNLLLQPGNLAPQFIRLAGTQAGFQRRNIRWFLLGNLCFRRTVSGMTAGRRLRGRWWLKLGSNLSGRWGSRSLDDKRVR